MAKDKKAPQKGPGEPQIEPGSKKPRSPAQQAHDDWKRTRVVPEGFEVAGLPPNQYLRRIRPALPEPVDPATTKFDRLLAMRFVVLNPKAQDQNEGHKLCREWLEKRPAEFMARLDALEAEEEERQRAKNASEEPAEEFESDRETRELLDRLLERYAEG